MGRALDQGRSFTVRSKERPFGGRTVAQELAQRFPARFGGQDLPNVGKMIGRAPREHFDA